MDDEKLVFEMSQGVEPILSFDRMGIKDDLLRGIYSYGFEKPSAIQQRAVLPIISGRDVIAQAQSGTGKTSMIALTVCHIADTSSTEVQALIMSPTRELAAQTEQTIRAIGNHMNIKAHACIGGKSVGEDIRKLESGVQVVSGTPGRVCDMIKRRSLRTRGIKLLILDESDEMLSRGFKDQIYDVYRYLPPELQVVLISATLPNEILEMTSKFMTDPVRILVKRDELTLEGQSYNDTDDAHKFVLDLGEFVGDLSVEEDDTSDDISLEGLQQELEECKNDDVVANILSKGTKLRDYTKGVENNLRQVELDSIQDYIKESDLLVSLHDQIRDCDIILSQMETLLGGFQDEIGSISSDIKILQEKSMDMGLKLKNRKVAESKLAKFVEDIIVPPRMIDIIVDGEVNDEYMRTLEILSKKLKFVEADSLVKTSNALKDVQPELERLRQKAVSKVFEFIVQKLYALRKPKTNIQILQQSVLLKYKYLMSFLKEHGKEIYNEVRTAYIDTMNKVLSAQFLAYIQALEKLQLDIATSSDLIGVETRGTSLFSRGIEPLKNRSAVFALGDRLNILKEIDEPALIPHIAEASSRKYPYEVLFRSLHKLLMDSATSEYLFCGDFFGEESIFGEIFAGPLAVIDVHFNSILPNCYDAIGLMLMICIIHRHQLIMSRRRIPCLDSYLDKVNISLWPRLKMVFDMHLNSLRSANVKSLWEDDVHPHYVMRRYAEFTASLIHLNVEYGDGQLELNMERLRMAVDDLLVKLARTFPKPKQQTVFLINNYDMMIAVLKEASEGGKIQMHFEELLKNNTAVFVEELLLEHFSDVIKFVKNRASEESSSSSEKPITIAEVDRLVKDFASRWKAAIELMHKDVITAFSNFLCGMDILRAALTQLLLYYTRLCDCIKKIPGGSALNKDLVSISSIMYEIRKYLRTF